ncbi:hypothetical protein [Desulfomarina sp.]
MTAISSLTSISRVSSAASQTGRQSQGDYRPVPGKIFTALVLEAQGEDLFLLDIAGKQLTATTKAPLAAGQSLRLQVVRSTPQIELKIVTQPQDLFFGRSLTLLEKNIDLSSLFSALSEQPSADIATLSTPTRNILNLFSTLQQQKTIDHNDSGTVLKQFIDKLGLSLEHMLADRKGPAAAENLKAALLEIANTFRNSESLAENTGKILNTIELFQLAQLYNNQDRQFILPLPLPFIEKGYLVVEYEEKNKGGGNDPENKKYDRFSLYLTMSDLGNIQIDFLQLKKTLYLRFRTDSDEKNRFVEQFGEQLKESLSGFPQINISFSQDAPDPIADLLQRVVSEDKSMVNTKA